MDCFTGRTEAQPWKMAEFDVTLISIGGFTILLQRVNVEKGANDS